MLKFTHGNIFESEATAIVNPVNTDGIMGKGLAYQFKKLFPNNFKIYEEKCKNKNFKIGNLLLTKENEKIIINFPTKTTWKENSKLEYITEGLKELEKIILENNISSIAIPPLGAGNGKLDWNLVKKELEKFSEKFENKNIEIFIYEPSIDESVLTKWHFLILKGILVYDEKISKDLLNDLIFQKLFYFSGQFLNKNYFKYSKNLKGPFSNTLNILYEELKKYVRLNKIKLSELEKILEKKYITDELKKEIYSIEKSVELIKNIKNEDIKNIEDLENLVELSATLIFILDSSEPMNENILFEKLLEWNKRKHKYSKENVSKMINFLRERNLVNINLMGDIILQIKQA